MYTQLEQRGMSEPPVNVSTLQDMKQSAVNTLKIRDMEYLHGPCSEM